MNVHKINHLGLGWFHDHAGGLERYQHGIATAQNSSKDIDVSAWVQSKKPIAPNAASYPVVAYASPDEPRAVKRQKLRKLAMERFRNADFTLISHHASVSGAILDLAKRVPHIVHFQGPWHQEARAEGAPRWKTWLQYREECKVYRSADRLITLSDAFKKILIDQFRIDADRIQTIPGGIDCRAAGCELSRSAARQQLDWPTDKKIMICVRRLVRRVGIDVLIEAVRLIKSQSPELLTDFVLYIGGRGPLGDELRQRVKDCGLADHVRFLGFVADELLPIAYRAADVSIVPTQSLEGFGLITLESMAAGTPCLVTPVGGLPEIATGLNPQLIIGGITAAAIAEHLRMVLRDELPLPDSEICQDYVQRNFDWSVIEPQVTKAYLTARK